MDSAITTIFDAMRFRNSRFSDDMADAPAMLKEWCGLEDSEGQQVSEPSREPEKMDALAQLAGGVAHEFNNILAIILLNAEMLGNHVGNDNKQVRAVIGQPREERSWRSNCSPSLTSNNRIRACSILAAWRRD